MSGRFSKLSSKFPRSSAANPRGHRRTLLYHPAQDFRTGRDVRKRTPGQQTFGLARSPRHGRGHQCPPESVHGLPRTSGGHLADIRRTSDFDQNHALTNTPAASSDFSTAVSCFALSSSKCGRLVKPLKNFCEASNCCSNSAIAGRTCAGGRTYKN